MVIFDFNVIGKGTTKVFYMSTFLYSLIICEGGSTCNVVKDNFVRHSR